MYDENHEYPYFIREHNSRHQTPPGVMLSTAQAPCASSAQSSRRFETKAEQSEFAEVLRWARFVATGDVGVTVFICVCMYICTYVLIQAQYNIGSDCKCVCVLSTDFWKASGGMWHNLNKTVLRRINKFKTFRAGEERRLPVAVAKTSTGVLWCLGSQGQPRSTRLRETTGTVVEIVLNPRKKTRCSFITLHLVHRQLMTVTLLGCFWICLVTNNRPKQMHWF